MAKDTARTTLPVTVPQSLHDAVAEAVSEPFAVSYLTGARVERGQLRPRTQTAHERLQESIAAMQVLDHLALTLGKPLASHEREPLPGSPAPIPTAEAWRPATDEEFARLSIRGKIRHHAGMANKGYTDAGPMWKRGKPVPREQMPPEWHETIARAKFHESEAKRLSQITLAKGQPA